MIYDVTKLVTFRVQFTIEAENKDEAMEKAEAAAVDVNGNCFAVYEDNQFDKNRMYYVDDVEFDSEEVYDVDPEGDEDEEEDDEEE